SPHSTAKIKPFSGRQPNGRGKLLKINESAAVQAGDARHDLKLHFIADIARPDGKTGGNVAKFGGLPGMGISLREHCPLLCIRHGLPYPDKSIGTIHGSDKFAAALPDMAAAFADFHICAGSTRR